MQTKKLKLTLLLAAAVLLPQMAWAEDGTDEQYNAAVSALVDGGYYTISTTYNETTYYLKSDGTLTTTQKDQGIFLFHQVTSWKTGFNLLGSAGGSNMTAFTNYSSSNSGKIITRSQSTFGSSAIRPDYDAQVLYYDSGTSKFAIRSTNHASGTYKENAYWTITTTDGVKIDYDITNLGTPNFIWNVTRADAEAFFDVTKTYELKQKATSKYIKRYALTKETDNIPYVTQTAEDIVQFFVLPVSGKTNTFYAALTVTIAYKALR